MLAFVFWLLWLSEKGESFFSSCILHQKKAVEWMSQSIMKRSQKKEFSHLHKSCNKQCFIFVQNHAFQIELYTSYLFKVDDHKLFSGMLTCLARVHCLCSGWVTAYVILITRMLTWYQNWPMHGHWHFTCPQIRTI